MKVKGSDLYITGVDWSHMGRYCVQHIVFRSLLIEGRETYPENLVYLLSRSENNVRHTVVVFRIGFPIVYFNSFFYKRYKL